MAGLGEIIAVGNDIPQGFPDLGQQTQILMLLHQILVTSFLGWTNRPDNDLPQVQGKAPARIGLRFLKIHLGRYIIGRWLSGVRQELF
jgi:hypothetical protein